MSEWIETTLGEVGIFVRGRRFTKGEYVDSGLGCIHYGQLYTHFGAFATSPQTFLPAEARGRLRLAAPGDVVLAATSENLADLGKATAWLGEDDVAVHDDCYIFRHNLDPVFASYLFASRAFQSQKAQYAAGTKVTRISGANLAKIEVAIPPLAEQRRIVDVLRAVDAHVAALAEERDCSLAAYASASSILWLDATGVEPPARPLQDIMSLDVERLRLEDSVLYRSAGVLNAGQGLIDKGSFRGDETEYAAMNVLRAGRVVMRKLTAWEGPITVVPTEFEGYVASNEFPTFRLNDGAEPQWMKHVCRTSRLLGEMKNRVTGSVQRRKRLKPEHLLAVALPIPPREAQAQAASALDALDLEVNALGDELDSLRAFRSSLLGALLDQEIEIPDDYSSLLDDVGASEAVT